MASNRRTFLENLAECIALLALSGNNNSKASEKQNSEAKLTPKVKRVVQITLVGGLSHLDSFDYKPNLDKFHGKTFQSEKPPDIFFGQIGQIRKNDWIFKQRGNSGLWISDLFPHIASIADDLTIIRSMSSESANHTPALFLENSGFSSNGFPAMGSWLSFGLGNENRNLPYFVVLPDGRGEPNGCASNWTNGFLPANHQGVVFRAGKDAIGNLNPPKLRLADEEDSARNLLNFFNHEHLKNFPADTNLAARIKSHAMAAKLQLSVPEATAISNESPEIQNLYGMDREETREFASRCILARRLLERDVRFVQLYSGGPIGGNPRSSWDAHENVLDNHSKEALKIDRPVAALVKDLKRRGMLEDTLVLFTTEFGRTPFAQSAAGTVGTGRDHNKYGFSVWMAGAGVKKGFSFGATDEIGWKAAEKIVPWHDFHATILYLMGIDHEKLTFYHNGIQRRLTNVHGEILKDILL